MNYQPFTPKTHQELAQLLVDSNNPAVCIQHFSNEGYDPDEIQSQITSLINQTSLVGRTLRVGDAAMPVNNLCPQPTVENGVFKTPHGARILFEMQDPHIVLYDNFITPLECDQLIALCAERFNRSLVVGGPGETVADTRSSQTAHLAIGQDPYVKALEARIAETVHWPTLKAESLQIIKYEPGQEYQPHYDFFEYTEASPYLVSPGFQRTATMILYLQEPEAGGATSFPRLRLKVPARRGQALFFSYPTPNINHQTLHGGDPVIEGVKIIATKWFKTLQHGC
jgi:prolyl 4-hydroxylase